MWQSSYEATTNEVSIEQVWKVWADINHWHEWDDGIEIAKTNEPFQKGCHFELKPKNGPKVKLLIVECEKGKYFTDLCRFPMAKMYGHHEVEKTKDGYLRLKTTMTVSGILAFLWRILVVQKIVDDLPKDTAKLIAAAKKIII